ncbi:MAG: hypothetical protein C0600_14550 [Ignavibacteria bacterium]|nr:MAG: hypothetical protein C0600_14550 [Ignavibacteria bacterium]
MWKRILATAHRFGFTRNEAAVVVFLCAVIIVGTILTEVRSSGARPVEDIRTSYEKADRAFADRSTVEISQADAGTESVRENEKSPDVAPAVVNAAQTPQAIDPNTATQDVLTSLPGVGPATARNIIEYRREHGPFRQPEDLLKVQNIGPKKFERIRTFITIE